MSQLVQILQSDVLDPTTLVGAAFFCLVFLGIAVILSVLIRRVGNRAEVHFTDVTGLRFATSFAQILVFLLGFIIYAHLIPELRSLGTAVLAGASVTSLVLGLAAKSTLSNLIAGLSLVLYRPIRVGDRVRLTTPMGPSMATIESVSLGYTHLRDSDGNQIIVPNSVMISSVMIRVENRKL